MNENNGCKIWYFPDGELPPTGEGILKGHESLIILNDNNEIAKIRLTLFFADKDPVKNITFEVQSHRVRCIRMDDFEQIGGFMLPIETQYAVKLESDRNIIAQYGRLDTRQENMAFYTTMGYHR